MCRVVDYRSQRERQRPRRRRRSIGAQRGAGREVVVSESKKDSIIETCRSSEGTAGQQHRERATAREQTSGSHSQTSLVLLGLGQGTSGPASQISRAYFLLKLPTIDHHWPLSRQKWSCLFPLRPPYHASRTEQLIALPDLQFSFRNGSRM